MNAAVADEVQLDPGVRNFIAQQRRMLINGDWVDSASGETLDVYNPATGDVIAHVPAGNQEDIDRAVKAARQSFETRRWTGMTPSERGRIIWKIGDLILDHLEELAQLESLDNGKPISVARVADVPLSADMFHYMAGWATKIEGDTISISVPYAPGAQYHAYTVKEPVGVVGQIIPWNFPLLMAAWKLAPALACGCTIVLKPAEETPLSALRLGELIQEAGVPDGVVNIVTGLGQAAGAPLAAHPDVDKIAFTGSTEVGRLIVKAAESSNLKKVSLELGGKSPNIVLADADLETAIAGAANSIFFNHGQCCAAGSRLFVQEKVFDKVAEGVSEVASKMKLGPGLDPSTEMGPLVSSDQVERVTGYLEAGVSEGARALTGGKRRGDKGYFVEPTVFVDTKPEMKICAEEIFGPVVTATPFKDVDDALVAAANNTVYGLASGIWTKDVSKAHMLASKLKAGTVWINCYNIFDAALPFGGYKQSGWGREMGHEVLKNYLETKSVCINLG
ncbi:MAG TPA: aldehyde dehydrogenase family protein [Gammaproteobacteria bacterium]|nr:aldehyde dehydrogenase family protein [Gammaproteobacteria bacterium]